MRRNLANEESREGVQLSTSNDGEHPLLVYFIGPSIRFIEVEGFRDYWCY